MIELTTAGACIGAEKRVLMDIDKIFMLQRQMPANGKDFTAIFHTLQGMPPFMAEELPDEIRKRIAEARRKRMILGWDMAKKESKT